DNFTKIIAHGNYSNSGSPEYFEVRRKDGSVSFFGYPGPSQASDDSAQIVTPHTDVIYAWPISRIEDSVSNYIEYSYEQPGVDAGGTTLWIEWIPKEVRYTGNVVAGETPPSRIEILTSAPVPAPLDAATQYIMGEPMKSTKLISKIRSYNDTFLIREYRLEYENNEFDHKQLHQIQECWGSGANDCISPTQFEWTDGFVSISNDSHGEYASTVDIYKFKGAQTADLDGNGRKDIVVLSKDTGPENAQFSVFRNNHFGQPPGQLTMSSSGGHALACNAEVSDVGGWATVDLEANGYQGVVYGLKDCGGQDGKLYYQAWNNQTSSFQTPVDIGDLPSVDWQDTVPQITPVDFNGDGLTDLLLTRSDPLNSSITTEDTVAWVYINESQDNVLSLAAYQGIDGLFDAIVLDPCSSGEETIDSQWFTLPNTPAFPVDHSGRTGFFGTAFAQRDCVTPGTAGVIEQQRSTWNLNDFEEELQRVGGGSRQFSDSIHAIFEISIDSSGAPTASPWTDSNGSEKLIPADFNADGYSDFLFLNEDGNQISASIGINDGTGIVNWAVSNPGIPSSFQIDVDYLFAGSIQVIDANGDGYPDIVAPTVKSGSNYEFRLYAWPFEFNSGELSGGVPIHTGNLKIEDGAQLVFVDAWGNGKTDIVRINKYSDDNFRVYSESGALGTTTGQQFSTFTPANKIVKITDGFGAETEIEYKSLAQTSVYTRDNVSRIHNPIGGGQVYDLMVPNYVVASVHTLVPQYNGTQYDADGIASVEYYYVGAKIQGNGRGHLGFREIATFDVQSRVLKHTQYRQDFPYIGMPDHAETRYIQPGDQPWPEFDTFITAGPTNDLGQANNPIALDGGVLLSKSENTWNDLHGGTQNQLGYYSPVRSKIQEWSYSATNSGASIGSAQLIKRVVTESPMLEHDLYGNPERVTVTVYDQGGNMVSSQSTQNLYSNDPLQWHLGRLYCAEVTSARNGAPSIPLRRTRFEYHPSTGLLTKEVVEPTGCTSNAGHALLTEYDHDDFGNRKRTTVSGPDITTRVSSKVYDDKGRYVDQQRISLTGSASNWRITEMVRNNSGGADRDRYGNPFRVVNAQGLASIMRLDPMGREWFTATETGASAEKHFSQDTGDLNYCPNVNEIALVEVVTPAGGPTSMICKDLLGREVRSITQGFGYQSGSTHYDQWIYVDTRYDYASRPVAVSEPYVPASSPYCTQVSDSTCLTTAQIKFTQTTYDALGRVVQVRLPNGELEYVRHAGLMTEHTNVLGQKTQTWVNELGETVEETRLAENATTTFTYDALGQLLVTDGPLPNDTISIEYDYGRLGNKSKVTDPDKGIWQYKYNALGDLLCQADALGQGVLITYDNLGRQVSRDDFSSMDTSS
ncbi:MAG: hypothetical protein AAGH65_07315, partial [Pseudomonadota bacterium]